MGENASTAPRRPSGSSGPRGGPGGFRSEARAADPNPRALPYDAKRDLPVELLKWLELPPPRAIILRGRPGTGKTTLALGLAEAFAGERIVIAGRVARDQLLDQHPWFRQAAPERTRLLDGQALSQDPLRSDDLWSRARSLLTDPDAYGPSNLLWLPAPIQEAWSQVSDSRSLVVVDSWDSMIERYMGPVGSPDTPLPTRGELEETLFNLLARQPAHLVLVLEREEMGRLEYLADATLTLERSLDNVWARQLVIEKVRGVEITTSAYPFTLHESRFVSFLPAGSADWVQIAPPDPDPQPGTASLWPGSYDFALAFGRLPLGTITLLEVDRAIPREAPRAILSTLVVHVLQNGGRALLIPAPTLDPADQLFEVRQQLPSRLLERSLRMVTVLGHAEGQDRPSPIYVNPARLGWTKGGASVPVLEHTTIFDPTTDANAPNVLVSYFSGLEALTQTAGVPLSREVLPGFARVAFGREAVHMFAIGRTGDPHVELVQTISELHVRLVSRHGRIIVYGHRPQTRAFAMTRTIPTSPYTFVPLV
jgi:KaiC/GvpD/RAD55 family RecA-like ATPase